MALLHVSVFLFLGTQFPSCLYLDLIKTCRASLTLLLLCVCVCVCVGGSPLPGGLKGWAVSALFRVDVQEEPEPGPAADIWQWSAAP